LKVTFGAEALWTEVDGGDHQHVGGPTLDDVAWRTHVAFPFVGGMKIFINLK
jgi:hypothetical protein